MKKNCKRILIIPGGQFQRPLVQVARQTGLETVVMDIDPEAPCLRECDHPECLDPLSTENVLQIARKYAVDGIVSVASDPCIVSAADAAAALGLPGPPPESIRAARNKATAFQVIAEKRPDLVPPFYVLNPGEPVSHALEKVPLPVVVKPVDGNGSKGVKRIMGGNSPETLLADAVDYARQFSPSRRILVCALLQGQEVSVEGMVTEQETVIAAITDKTVTAPPYCVEIAHSIPSGLPPVRQVILKEAASAIIKALGLVRTGFHVELFDTQDGPKLVEAGPRLGGGCITSHLVPLATGIDLMAATVALALGEEPELQSRFQRAAAIRFLTPPPGKLLAMSDTGPVKALPGINEIYCPLKPGASIKELRHSGDRAGYVIASGETLGAVISTLGQAVQSIHFEVEPSE